MSSRLKEAVVQRDQEKVEQLISSLEQENWSLVTIIDELLPLILMESNLQFGNFHAVKMAIFLRKLAIEGYFSKATEKELARVIALETVEREWVSIHASRAGYAKRDISSPLVRTYYRRNMGKLKARWIMTRSSSCVHPETVSPTFTIPSPFLLPQNGNMLLSIMMAQFPTSYFWIGLETRNWIQIGNEEWLN